MEVLNLKISNQPKWSEVKEDVSKILTAKNQDIVQVKAISFLNSAKI